MNESERAAEAAWSKENLAIAQAREIAAKNVAIAKAMNDKPAEAILFATDHIKDDLEAMEFLRTWSRGDFAELQEHWPEYPQAVRK